MSTPKATHKLSKEFNKRPSLDNAPGAIQAKIDIRRRVLDFLGPDNCTVLDCFAGTGLMYKYVWKGAKGYTGVDERFVFDRRTAYVADNRILLRAIDLQQFNCVDADAYGSPYEALLIFARRRKVAPGERIGICFTDGTGTKLKFGSLPLAMAELAGVPVNAAGISREWRSILDRTIAGIAKTMRCQIVKRFEAVGKTGAKVVYVGLVLEGLAPESEGANALAPAPASAREFELEFAA
jgi:hypothetical protein